VEVDSALDIQQIAYLYISIIESTYIHSLQQYLDRIFMKDVYIVLYSNVNPITHGEQYMAGTYLKRLCLQKHIVKLLPCGLC
jgi:hypothetical protein